MVSLSFAYDVLTALEKSYDLFVHTYGISIKAGK